LTAFRQSVSVLRKQDVMNVARTELCSTSAMIPSVQLVAHTAPTGPLLNCKNVARVEASTELGLRLSRPLIVAMVSEAIVALKPIKSSSNILGRLSQRTNVIDG
jgi:hypothetical protein